MVAVASISDAVKHESSQSNDLMPFPKKWTIIANFGFRLQKAHSQPVIFTSPRGDPIVYFPDYPLKKEVKPKSRYVPGPAAMVDAFPHLLPKPHQHHQGCNSIDILHLGNLECK